MPPPRKPSPRGRDRRTRSRSYSPRPSYSSRRSRSRSPREKRRSVSPARKRSPPRRRSRSPRERSRSPRQIVRRTSPRRSPKRRSRSHSYERGQQVKRVAADSSVKRVSSYRSRSPSPKRSRDEREYRDEPRRSDSRRYSSPGRSQERREGSRERKYSPRGRSPSPRHKESSSSYGGKMYSDKPSSSRAPLFPIEKRKKEISSVTIVNKARLEKLDKRFQTLEQISRGGFDFEENITIGIHRGPSHVALDEDIPVDYHFNPKNFLMLFPKKETHRPIFDRDEILQFHHDDILDEEAYVEKRTITVKPTEKAKSKYSDSLDYKITIGGRSTRDADYGDSDRRMVRDSGRRRSRDHDPEVTVRLDPKPDPRYERLFKETQRRERSRSRSRSPRNPLDLRHNLNKHRREDHDLDDDRGRDRDSGRSRHRSQDDRDVFDARKKIEARRSLGSADIHITKTELRERRRSQDRMRKEKGRASLEKELPDFKNRPEAMRHRSRSRSPPSRTSFLDRIPDLPISNDHDVRLPARTPRQNDPDIQKVWIFGTGEMNHLRDLGRNTSLGTDLGLLKSHNIMVHWYTKRGLKFRDVLKAVHNKIDKGFTPAMIILHCGGNDLYEPENDLESEVRMTVDAILNELPSVKIVWSMILPRWLGPGDVGSINRRRNQVNDRIARFVLDNGGSYLRYPSITLQENHLYKESPDGDLMLSDEGYDRLLSTLKGGIISILIREITIAPDLIDLEPSVNEFIQENREKFYNRKGGYRGRGGSSYRGRGRARSSGNYLARD